MTMICVVPCGNDAILVGLEPEGVVCRAVRSHDLETLSVIRSEDGHSVTGFICPECDGHVLFDEADPWDEDGFAGCPHCHGMVANFSHFPSQA